MTPPSNPVSFRTDRPSESDGAPPTLRSLPDEFEGRLSTDDHVLSSYSTASGPYRIRPRAVAAPRSVADVQSLVRWASRQSLSLIPRGAATGMPGGNVGDGVVVDLTEGFRGIEPVDPDGRQVRVGPAAIAAEVNRAAREHGLFLPPLPSSAERCTIGGMVANNAAGARTFKYGATRDWVASLEVVLADGRRVELGSGPAPAPFSELRLRLLPSWEDLSGEWPDVVKNSSGYALDRFLPSGDPAQLVVGSEGTLGLITSVTLELAPLPESRVLLLTAAREPADLLTLVGRARELDASACEFFGHRFIELAELEDDPRVGSMARNAYALVMVEFDGPASAVEDTLSSFQETARELGSVQRVARTSDERNDLWDVRHAASPVISRAAEQGRVSMQFIEDSVVPPSRLLDYLEGVEEILAEARTDAVVFGHAGDGNVHVNPLVDVEEPGWRERVSGILERTVDLVARLGGTLAGEHGDGRVRAPYLDRIWSEEAVRSFRMVKDALDPANLLNPGVILPVEGLEPLSTLYGAPERR